MAGGLVLFGVAGYVFVALTGHTLAKDQANLALAFYFLVNVIGPGIFVAIEQVVSRATSAALTAGRPLGPALRRAQRAGVGLVAAVLLILLALSPVLVGSTLHGDWLLFAEVLATPVIAAMLHLIRGRLAGARRFGGYAGTLAVEGVARLLFTALLAVGGVSGAWLYGLGYLGASVVAVLAGVLWLRRGVPGGTGDLADHPPMGKSLAALALATLFSQFLPNIAPLVVTSRLAADSAVALAFGQAAVVARIPVLIFFPIQTMLLPAMTSAVTRGDLALVTRRLRQLFGAIAGVGALAVPVFVLIGPWVLRTFLGATVELATSVMVLLVLSTVVLLLAYAAQPALVALGSDQVVTLAWALGSSVTLGLALLPADAVTMGALGQLVGPGLTLLVVLLGLRTALRAPLTPAAAPVDVKP